MFRRFNSRRVADWLWSQRDEIMERYRGCTVQQCRARDAELGRVSRLPDPNSGTWRNADGTPAAAGDGLFVPNEGTNLHAALSRHPNGAQGIPYNNGQADLSAFPPRGSAGPNGKPYSVEIQQSLDGDRAADRSAAWGQWRQDFPGKADPSRGVWHHTGDGVTMQYVDESVHGALAHQGGVAMNTSPGF